MNEKDSARFFSSNLSVPTSPLTTTLRTDTVRGRFGSPNGERAMQYPDMPSNMVLATGAKANLT